MRTCYSSPEYAVVTVELTLEDLEILREIVGACAAEGTNYSAKKLSRILDESTIELCNAMRRQATETLGKLDN